MTSHSKSQKGRAKRYLANLQGEVDSATFYRALADLEARPEIAKVYARLADIEQTHAEFWKKRLLAQGHLVPTLRIRWRSRALIWLARRFGPGVVLALATSLERADSGYYETQP